TYRAYASIFHPPAPTPSFLPFFLTVPPTTEFYTLSLHDALPICVVETGTAYGWGRNDYGQLGNGNAGVDSKVPVPVSGGIRFQYVSMGRDHACGLARSGEILCWGDNRGGQLGNPNAGAGSDVPVLVSGGLTYTALSVGDISSCALEVAGDAYCWGFAAPTDQEGSPTSTAPALVTGGVVFAQVDPGTFVHMGGVRTSHEGYCWGQ